MVRGGWQQPAVTFDSTVACMMQSKLAASPAPCIQACYVKVEERHRDLVVTCTAISCTTCCRHSMSRLDSASCMPHASCPVGHALRADRVCP
jgi:hypothetical protein